MQPNTEGTVNLPDPGFLDGFVFDWGIYVVIFIVSVIALTIIIERLIYFQRAKSLDYYVLTRIKSALQEGRYEEAQALAKANQGPASQVIQVGIERLVAGSTHIAEEMQQAGNEQVAALEKYVSGLATIATIAPLLGILGTVLGMIKAFANYAEGSNKAGMLAGINVALYTTALGLLIAIPAYIFYNWLVRRMNDKIVAMEGAVTQVQPVMLKRQGR